MPCINNATYIGFNRNIKCIDIQQTNDIAHIKRYGFDIIKKDLG